MSMFWRKWSLLMAGGLVWAVTPSLHAQTTDSGRVATNAPAATAKQEDDAALLPPLARLISLKFDRTPLPDALRRIAAQGGVELTFAVEALPAHQTVTLSLDRVTVRHAFQQVLRGTALDLFVSDQGQVAIVRRGPAAVQPGGASVAGYVRDSATGASIPLVTIRVDGTALEAKSDAHGAYKISGISPGEYRVTARRVGYIARTLTITVSDEQAATLNFALSPPATKLDEVVTTAVGEQRRYEVGNVISTINVDSVAPTAPVTSVTDILTARAPGLEVVETGGLTGSGESIRIRGESSLVLQGDPIIIVDGIREDNTPGGVAINDLVLPSPSRLNDIDFSQIQTIDVLKGPAASTEYGTDAANGVIVITTKRGVAGRPLWQASGEQTTTNIPRSFPEYYYSWGHATDGSSVAEQCALNAMYLGQYAQYGAPYTIGGTRGSCVVDSVTAFNPLDDPQTSLFGTGDRRKYDLSVGGGTDAMRYYVGGNLSTEIGVTRLPSVFRSIASGLGLPNSVLNPNSEDQRSLRTTSTVRLGPTADLVITGAYMSTYQETPPTNNLMWGPVRGGAILPDAAHDYGYGTNDQFADPIGNFGQNQSQQTNRLTGGMNAHWHPSAWLNVVGTVGIDHGSGLMQLLDYSNTTVYQGLPPGDSYLAITNMTNDIYSADFRASATVTLTRSIRAITSTGIQLADTRSAGVTSSGEGMSMSNFTLNGATTQLGSVQAANRSATVGGYVEEQLNLAERVFLIGALRVDAGSGFGRTYSTAAYPKLSASWLAINQGPTNLRFRAAMGVSGVQPYNGAAIELYTASETFTPTGNTSSLTESAPGNPNLRPERSNEYEGGFDLGLANNRLTVEFTTYTKITQDALLNETLGFDLGALPYQINIGEIRNSGVEAAVTASIIQTHQLTFDVTVNGSLNQNKLVHLAPGVDATQDEPMIFTGQLQRPGYPLYGYWGIGTSYADANHDGIIDGNEVTLADSLSYVGTSLPGRKASASGRVGLWRNSLVFSGLFDYGGGFKILNENVNEVSAYGNESLQEQNVPNAPLWMQGRAVALQVFTSVLGYPVGLFEDGSYLRFRELSVTYNAPSRWARELRLHSIGLTGAARNLALWTRFSGPDPESSDPGGTFPQQQFNTNTYTVNNNLRANGIGAVPLARYLMVRLNLGF